MELYDAVRIDQHVASQLIDVVRWAMESLAGKQQFDVLPPIRKAQHLSFASSLHAVSAIENAFPVDTHREFDIHFSDILFGSPFLLECDDQQVHIVSSEPVFVLPQLRQVLAARKSRKMSMKYKQQPTVTVVTQLTLHALDIGELEIESWLSREFVHQPPTCSKKLEMSAGRSSFNPDLALNGL